MLVSHQDKVVSREALIEWVWAGHHADRRRADAGHHPVAQGVRRRPRRAALPGDDRQGRLPAAGAGGVDPAAGQWPRRRLVSRCRCRPRQRHRPSRRVLPATALPTTPALPRCAPLHADAAELASLARRGRRLSCCMQRRRVPAVASASAPVPVAAPPCPWHTSASLRCPAARCSRACRPDGSQVVYSALCAEGGEHADLMVQTTAPVPGTQDHPAGRACRTRCRHGRPTGARSRSRDSGRRTPAASADPGQRRRCAHHLAAAGRAGKAVSAGIPTAGTWSPP